LTGVRNGLQIKGSPKKGISVVRGEVQSEKKRGEKKPIKNRHPREKGITPRLKWSKDTASQTPAKSSGAMREKSLSKKRGNMNWERGGSSVARKKEETRQNSPGFQKQLLLMC